MLAYLLAGGNLKRKGKPLSSDVRKKNVRKKTVWCSKWLHKSTRFKSQLTKVTVSVWGAWMVAETHG